MPSYSRFHAALVAGLGVCVWMGGAVFPARAAAPGAHVSSVKLKVNVDHSAKCKLSLSASIEASGLGTVWYRFSGPAGVTFDFGGEGTKTLEFDRSFGAGRGANMTADIHGALRVEAAMIDANGQRGAEVSDSVPADYTCGNGSAIASAIPPLAKTKPVAAPAASTQSRVAARPGFRVTAVKLGKYTANFNGSCPTDGMAFRWELTADGKGTAVVRFLQESRPIREERIDFTGPGTQVATYTPTRLGSPGGHYHGWIVLEVLFPNPVAGGRETYTMQCAPRAR